MMEALPTHPERDDGGIVLLGELFHEIPWLAIWQTEGIPDDRPWQWPWWLDSDDQYLPR